jgi:hypothetical protein
MGTTLDGQNLFDEQGLEIEPGSASRDAIERTIPGLDGALSIDLGGRSRKIKQRGVLRAKSRFQMDGKIVAISAHMDGNTHTLITGDGKRFDNLRMDAFKTTEEEVSGDGLCCDYEIVYTQLAV